MFYMSSKNIIVVLYYFAKDVPVLFCMLKYTKARNNNPITCAVFLPPFVTMLSEFEGYWKAWMKNISDFQNYSRHRRSTRSGVHLNAPASQVDQLGRRRFCHP